MAKKQNGMKNYQWLSNHQGKKVKEVINMTTLEKLNQLPNEIIEEVKNVLKAYDECDVYYEYGRFNVMVGACIRSKYADDFKFISNFKAQDIYSEEEMKQNYKETFGYEY